MHRLNRGETSRIVWKLRDNKTHFSGSDYMLLKPLVAAWYSWRRSRSMIVSPSAERNKGPIAEVLARLWPRSEARLLNLYGTSLV